MAYQNTRHPNRDQGCSEKRRRPVNGRALDRRRFYAFQQNQCGQLIRAGDIFVGFVFHADIKDLNFRFLPLLIVFKNHPAQSQLHRVNPHRDHFRFFHLGFFAIVFGLLRNFKKINVELALAVFHQGELLKIETE